jgi:protein arginine N-methyltransferase 3
MDGEFAKGHADQGYALLYESMLDSVLYARDHFMKEGGLMAPSQTAMKLVGITGERLWKERIDFWQSVYGESSLNEADQASI